MRITPWVAGFAVISAIGCTITEELPTRPDLIRVPTTGPAGGAPSPLPSPVPLPSPAATPAPAPSVPPAGPDAVPTPNPAATPVATPPPSPLPSPSPSPSPNPNNLPASNIDSIRVGFFGINCGRGNPVPRNGERVLPRGCRGYVTATPKQANGDDVPARIHGPNIAWFVLTGEDMISVQAPTFPSDFNKDIVAERTGAFGLCATVREVTGCLMGTVIP